MRQAKIHELICRFKKVFLSGEAGEENFWERLNNNIYYYYYKLFHFELDNKGDGLCHKLRLSFPLLADQGRSSKFENTLLSKYEKKKKFLKVLENEI